MAYMGNIATRVKYAMGMAGMGMGMGTRPWVRVRGHGYGYGYEVMGTGTDTVCKNPMGTGMGPRSWVRVRVRNFVPGYGYGYRYYKSDAYLVNVSPPTPGVQASTGISGCVIFPRPTFVVNLKFNFIVHSS